MLEVSIHVAGFISGPVMSQTELVLKGHVMQTVHLKAEFNCRGQGQDRTDLSEAHP